MVMGTKAPNPESFYFFVFCTVLLLYSSTRSTPFECYYYMGITVSLLGVLFTQSKNYCLLITPITSRVILVVLVPTLLSSSTRGSRVERRLSPFSLVWSKKY